VDVGEGGLNLGQARGSRLELALDRGKVTLDLRRRVSRLELIVDVGEGGLNLVRRAVFPIACSIVAKSLSTSCRRVPLVSS
jgi:hypothetical protein